MRTVALVSGGKDSILSLLLTHAYGHEIVCIAQLTPAATHHTLSKKEEEELQEIDSPCFQTVGHHGVEFIAECLGIPLRCRSIVRDQCVDGTLEYLPQQQQQQEEGEQRTATNHFASQDDSIAQQQLQQDQEQGDEVEVMYRLLAEVKDEFSVEAVCSGAILSDYQRIRVESCCSRLKLTSLAFLWQRRAENILSLVELFKVDARLIKTATMGLHPRKHLGKSLVALKPFLLTQKELFHIAGEGGEFETIVLDCPLFQTHRLEFVEPTTVNMVDDNPFAPVGHLLFKLRRVPKTQQEQAEARHAMDIVQSYARMQLNYRRTRELFASSVGGAHEQQPQENSLSVFDALWNRQQQTTTRCSGGGGGEGGGENCCTDQLSTDFPLLCPTWPGTIDDEESSSDCRYATIGLTPSVVLRRSGSRNHVTSGGALSPSAQLGAIFEYVFKNAKGGGGHTAEDIHFVLIHAPSMQWFKECNEKYVTYFHHRAPARAFLEVSELSELSVDVFFVPRVPPPLPVFLAAQEQKKNTDEGARDDDDECEDVVELNQQFAALWKSPEQKRKVLHVQSISSWSAASIGPYAQANRTPLGLAVAGRIGLEPETLSLMEAGRAAGAAETHTTATTSRPVPGSGIDVENMKEQQTTGTGTRFRQFVLEFVTMLDNTAHGMDCLKAQDSQWSSAPLRNYLSAAGSSLSSGGIKGGLTSATHATFYVTQKEDAAWVPVLWEWYFKTLLPLRRRCLADLADDDNDEDAGDDRSEPCIEAILERALPHEWHNSSYEHEGESDEPATSYFPQGCKCRVVLVSGLPCGALVEVIVQSWNQLAVTDPAIANASTTVDCSSPFYPFVNHFFALRSYQDEMK